jgi:hypothetical protein
MPRLLLAVIAATFFGLQAPSQCSMTWSDALGGTGITVGAVNAALQFDDGTGPSLYVGGSFRRLGGGDANTIARWSGGRWSEIPGIGPVAYYASGISIDSLAAYDSGSGPRLYAGGTFATADGVPAGGIASWNGAAWSTLGAGVAGAPVAGAQSRVSAMIAFDDGTGEKLVVGGSFTTAGGLPANSIARWDGAAWSTMSSPFLEVFALAVHDQGTGPALYAAVSVLIGGSVIHGVAQWTGTTWVPVGGPTDGPVLSLTSVDIGSGPRLAAGGTFTNVNGVAANNVAEWNGTQWAPLGPGVSGTVRALSGFDDGSGQKLYAGGAFSIAGTQSIARFGSGVWAAVGGGLGPSYAVVNVLTPWSQAGSPVLVAAGLFITAFATPTSLGIEAQGIASWTGSLWNALGGGMTGGTVAAFATFDDGSGPALYAGGSFTTAGGVEIRAVARRTLSGWAPVGSGFDGPVLALAVFDDGSGPALYAGGQFMNSGTTPVYNVARLTNGAWTALGMGILGNAARVQDLAVFDDGSGPALYAGGYFQFSGGFYANSFAKWNGVSWQQFMPGTVGGIDALEVFDDGTGPALYAAGTFTFIGSVTALNIARWNGTAWSPVGGGLTAGFSGAWVHALTVHDFGSGPRLVAGGNLSLAGLGPSDAAVQWNGASWAAVAGPPPGTGGAATAFCFATFDDGTGPALTMGTGPNGYAPPTFAALWRLTPGGWSPIGMLMPPPVSNQNAVFALHVFDGGTGPALWAGGLFTQSGAGVGSSNIARFGAPRALVSLQQPGGPGTSGYIVNSDLVPGHEYFNVFSPDVCPGPPGSGPYLGLCSNDLNVLVAQVLLPLGSPPFHFIAPERTLAFGPFTLPAGTTYDAICSDFTGGTIHCVSNVGRLTIH